MGHASRACTPGVGAPSSAPSVVQRRGWWPLRLGAASSTANQEERLRAAQFERFLLGPEPSTPATDADVQLFEVKFLRPAVRGGEPESFLRVTHLPSGKVWQTKRSLDDWLRLEDAVEAEAQALDTLREQSEERSLSSGELPRTLADALEAAGLHPFEPPPAKQALRARRDVPLRKVLEDVRARLFELLQDEELGRCGTLQRFLGVQSPEMPSTVLIKKLQATLGETMIEAELEVMMCAIEDDGQPWAAATHVVAAVSGMVHSQGRPEKFEFEPWFSNVAALASPDEGIRIGFHGLRPDMAVEFEVRSVNAVGYSAPVLIRTFTPPALQSMETSPATEPQQAAFSTQRWTTHQSSSCPDGGTALNRKESAEMHRQQGAEFLGINLGTGADEEKHPAPNTEASDVGNGSMIGSAMSVSEAYVADKSSAATVALDKEVAETVRGPEDAACEPAAPEIVVAHGETLAGDLPRLEVAPQRQTSKTLVESAESSTLQAPAGKLQTFNAPAPQDVFEEPEEDFADACSTFSKEEPEDTSQAGSSTGLGAGTQSPVEQSVPNAEVSAAEQMRMKLAARRNSDDFLEDERQSAPEEASSAAADPTVGEAASASTAEATPSAASVEGIGSAFDDCQKLLGTLELAGAHHRELESKDLRVQDAELAASSEGAANTADVTGDSAAVEQATAEALAVEGNAEDRQLEDAPEIAGAEGGDAPEIAGAHGSSGSGAALNPAGSHDPDAAAAPAQVSTDEADAGTSANVSLGAADESRRVDADAGASTADPGDSLATDGSSASPASGTASDEKDTDKARALSAPTAVLSESLQEGTASSSALAPQDEAKALTAAPTTASDSSNSGSVAPPAPPAPPSGVAEAIPAEPTASKDQLTAPAVSAMAKAGGSAPSSPTQAAYPAASAQSQAELDNKPLSAAGLSTSSTAAAAAAASGTTAAGTAGSAASSASSAPGTTAAAAVAAGSSVEVNGSQPQKPAPQPAPLQPGCVLVAGFQVKKQLLPTKEDVPCDVRVLERSTEVAQRRASQVTTISRQQALRMLMGLNMDVNAVVEKASAVKAWRQQNRLAEIRESLMAQLAAPRTTPVQLPYGDSLQQMMAVDACALVTPDGCPVSVWHVGTANTAQAASVSADELTVWSCAFFEYVDLWISEMSESTGCLAGHIQVFNLDGLNFWHVSNTALINKLKAALSAGGNYVEAISHMYVINSGRVFSMAWGIVKGLISPRTAGKITVANDVPKELLQVLGERSAKRLPGILRAARPAPVQRPPATAAAPSR